MHKTIHAICIILVWWPILLWHSLVVVRNFQKPKPIYKSEINTKWFGLFLITKSIDRDLVVLRKKWEDNATHKFRSVMFFFFLNNGHTREHTFGIRCLYYTILCVGIMTQKPKSNQTLCLLACNIAYFHRGKKSNSSHFLLAAVAAATNVIRFFFLRKIANNDGNAPPKWRLIWCVYCIVIWSRFISLRWCSGPVSDRSEVYIGKHE